MTDINLDPIHVYFRIILETHAYEDEMLRNIGDYNGDLGIHIRVITIGFTLTPNWEGR